MTNTGLKEEYISVLYKDGASYGGSQNELPVRKLKLFGCGLVAIGDIILYITGRNKKAVDRDVYNAFLMGLEKRFFYIPGLLGGISGPFIALGFNIWALVNKAPFVAFWMVPQGRVPSAVLRMLDNDIPVLFSCGACFPWIWKRDGIKLYTGDKDNPVYAGRAVRHYMVISGVQTCSDGRRVYRISSWGKKYYIFEDEYINFMKNKSNSLFTNILFIRRMKKI